MNLIDHLPRESYFVEALLNDDQFAEQLLNMPDAPGSRERMSEWSPLREGLARVEDAVHELQAAVIAAAGVKPPKVERAVRPITAVDRARHQRRRQEHASIVARVLPGRT